MADFWPGIENEIVKNSLILDFVVVKQGSLIESTFDDDFGLAIRLDVMDSAGDYAAEVNASVLGSSRNHEWLAENFVSRVLLIDTFA